MLNYEQRIKSNICDFSDAYIFVSGTITIKRETDDDDDDAKRKE